MYKNFFSIILTCYNSEKYLHKTLKSIFYQKYDNFEIIITDNCSIDNTVREIRKFKSKKIKLHLMKKNIGRVKALNFAIKKSKGQYICILAGQHFKLVSSKLFIISLFTLHFTLLGITLHYWFASQLSCLNQTLINMFF